jgi:hypothetical protein
MKRKTPQEKKALSYAKDRRNTYGENDKSSRKNIPRSRSLPHRANRRGARQALRPAADDAAALPVDQVEDGLKHRFPRRWRKTPDEPLGAVLERRVTEQADRGRIPEALAAEKLERIRRRFTSGGFPGRY